MIVRQLLLGGRLFLAPALSYLAIFSVLTFPRMLQISSELLCDSRDGLLGVWSIWWIHEAVTVLHQSPWHTRLLSYPLDVSLHGATLSPINGLLALPLFPVFQLATIANLMMVSSFVLTGLSAFWLAYRVTGAWFGSLVAGFIFAFSPYRFAHAQGHLNLLTMQWIPVFFLSWLQLLDRPSLASGLMAAGGLFLVCLSDYYYLTYAMIGAVVLALAIAAPRGRAILQRPYVIGAAAFLAASALTTGLIVRSFVVHNRVDAFTGRHNPYGYSLDPVGLVIPGAFWRFGSWTRWYWSSLAVNNVESSVALGVSVLSLVCFTAWRYRRGGGPRIAPWFALLVVSLVLACGPALHVSGLDMPSIPLPYLGLMKLFPMLALSGIPERMIVVASLAAAVICAAGVEALSKAGRTARAMLGLFLVVLLVEYLPAPIPATTLPFSDYPLILRADPRPGAVLDLTDPPPLAGRALYYQTIHHRPLTIVGRAATARGTVSMRLHGRLIRTLVEARSYRELRDRYGVLYVLSNADFQLPASYRSVLIPQLHQRGRLYDLSALAAD